MSPQKRTLAALSALLMTLLGVLGGSQAALASDAGQSSATPDGTRVTAVGTQYRTLVLPPAPTEAEVGGDFGITAVPTISPTVAVSYANPGQQYGCEYGTMCAWAWDTSQNKWKIFHLYNCRTYALSNWIGDGGWDNNQTTGTVARFYGSNGSTQVLSPSTAFERRHPISWNPVYYIRNC
ncbi:hypothetical protein [Promicromonospora panici]|uniref:hypothetical protein n=1 Tax=Promicromonospora panici TaxID=2219658 RepID=UPI00101C70B1|nr:hypothetical protein [Promicromonospora panici]